MLRQLKLFPSSGGIALSPLINNNLAVPEVGLAADGGQWNSRSCLSVASVDEKNVGTN
jgi:hypothetical protein